MANDECRTESLLANPGRGLGKTTVFLVRHAHADWRPDEKRPLSAAGVRAATAVAELLCARPIAAIYTSPSRRAIQTILPLAEALHLEPQLVSDLRERELPTVAANEFERAIAESWQFPERARSGAESNATAQSRGLAFLRRVLEANAGQQMVVSTHGNLLALMLNGFDVAVGYEFWRQLSFPDVYEAEFVTNELIHLRRIWDRGFESQSHQG
jgi:2,3-bisphosphoglycerate-dependent phosphoglycerate mutase